MRYAGNAIWFVFGGWYLSLIWFVGALIFAVSVIGLPITRSAIEIAKLSAFPFGKEVIHVRDLDAQNNTGTRILGFLGFLVNVVWFLTFGLVLFVGHLFSGLLACVTIIGIPFGLQSFKLAAIALWPVGRRVVSAELAQLVREERAATALARIRTRKTIAPIPEAP